MRRILTADHPDLVLEVAKWTATAVKLEVHNPTAAAIEATVSTPAEIKGLKPFSRKVTVPAGSTVYVEG